MKNFSITELAGMIKASLSGPESAGREFTGVSTDSRTVSPGDCFFALTGENFDGHDYVNEAFAKGAVCAVVERGVEGETYPGRCVLQVRDTIEALGYFAREYRQQAGFKVVVVTGSVGKTTTKQITAHVLGRFFRIHSSPKNFNNTIGVPLTLLGAPQDAEIVIAELGSNHPGEIAYLTRVAMPDIAVVTNVYPAHLEGFGDLQTIVREKLSIAEGLGPDGVLILNAGFDSLVDFYRNSGQKFLTFGQSEGSTYRVRDISTDGLVSRFTIDGVQVDLPLPGPGNVENALAAWAICSLFGLEVSDFARAVKDLPVISMRTEPVQVGTLTILNDCYNANPASMKNALQILAGMDSTGQRRKVFICGEMAELGEKAHELHAELGPFIANAGVELVLAVGKLAKIAAEAARASTQGRLQIKCFEDTPSACNKLHEFVKDFDIILVKGSRTAALERAVGKLKELIIEEPVSPG